MLLVVNKFRYLKYGRDDKHYYIGSGSKEKVYHKGCQNHLKVLKEDYKYECDEEQPVLPMGTVIYCRRPVIFTYNKEDWDIQIKTTGECFNGNYDEIQKLLSDILYKIRTGY